MNIIIIIFIIVHDALTVMYCDKESSPPPLLGVTQVCVRLVAGFAFPDGKVSSYECAGKLTFFLFCVHLDWSLDNVDAYLNYLYL